MKCVICGKHITFRFRLCAEHAQEYGGYHVSDHPPWLTFLLNDERKSERDNPNELSLDYVEDIMGYYPEQRLTGLFKEIYRDQERPTEEQALDNIEEDE